MASSSTPANPLFGHAISEKLPKNNYPLWKIEVLPIMRETHLEGFLTYASKQPKEYIIMRDGDKEANIVMYEAWVALDQQVLSFTLSIIPIKRSSLAGRDLQNCCCGMEDHCELIRFSDPGACYQCLNGSSHYTKR
jgi:hypothetical protein